MVVSTHLRVAVEPDLLTGLSVFAFDSVVIALICPLADDAPAAPQKRTRGDYTRRRPVAPSGVKIRAGREYFY